MKKCVDTAELLSDFLDGALPTDDSDALQAHLKDCPPCQEFMKSFKMAGSLTRNMLVKQIPTDFNAKLQNFLKTRIAKH